MKIMKRILLLTLAVSTMAIQASTESLNKTQSSPSRIDRAAVTITKCGACAFAANEILSSLRWIKACARGGHFVIGGKHINDKMLNVRFILNDLVMVSALAYGAYTVTQSDYRFGKQNNRRNKLMRATAVGATAACALRLYAYLRHGI